MEKEIIGIGSSIKHPEYGTGVIIQKKLEQYVVSFINYGVTEIDIDTEGVEIINTVEPPEDLISYEELEKAFINILKRYTDLQETVAIADKWRGGKIIFEPGTPGLAGKEIPINTFFHKIVMVRDRLRTLEQTVNSSNLPEDEKIHIQQYITRAYGSLTSFNVLFKYKSDYFIGQSSKAK